MENYNKLWRAFFAIGVTGIAVQQFIYSDFMPVIIPAGFPAWLTHRMVWAWVCSLIGIAAGVAIIFELKPRSISLSLGVGFLLFVFIFQIPGVLSLPFKPWHLGLWTNSFKELTLSGGALMVAGSFYENCKAPAIIKAMEKLIPLGKYFFAVTMVVFGYMHFLYPDFVATLVPNWIPGHLFWTYFAAVALIASGLGILLNIQRRLAALLLGIMLFLWVIMLHVPRAVVALPADHGNEWASVFEALAFSGMAFLLAGNRPEKDI